MDIEEELRKIRRTIISGEVLLENELKSRISPIAYLSYISVNSSDGMPFILHPDYIALLANLERETNNCTTLKEKKIGQLFGKVFHDIVTTYQELSEDSHRSNIGILEQYLDFDDFLYIVQSPGVNGEAGLELKSKGKEAYYEFLEHRIQDIITYATCQIDRLQRTDIFFTNRLCAKVVPSCTLRRSRTYDIVYEDCWIPSQGDLVIRYNEKTKDSTRNALVDFLAYVSCVPLFLHTDNFSFNARLAHLYENYDHLDMLKLRNPRFFQEKVENVSETLLKPLFVENKKEKLVVIPKLQHEKLFMLYHASLKQFEPLPRCVFLYRAFEYGVDHHYKKVMKLDKYSVRDAIEYYYEQVFSHEYLPLILWDWSGRKKDGSSEVSGDKNHAGEDKYHDYIELLKVEARMIEQEWRKDKYLKDKTIGKIIYENGRCAAAHGGQKEGIGRYDYSRNYRFMNNVNIIMELIVRYMIEIMHPELMNLLSHDVDEYMRLSILDL